MGKVGLDGHDRGAKVVMSALRDAGMEVIYSGLHQTPEALVRAAVEEDVDLIGLSILSGSHNVLIPKILAELKKYKLKIPLYVGGIIPAKDLGGLKKVGVKRVFTPGTKLSEIVDWVAKDVQKK
jgi:methylmalonyl-CoA mutase C-terminal domain/subunit